MCLVLFTGTITPRGCGFVIGYTASDSNEEFFVGDICNVSTFDYWFDNNSQCYSEQASLQSKLSDEEVFCTAIIYINNKIYSKNPGL